MSSSCSNTSIEADARTFYNAAVRRVQAEKLIDTAPSEDWTLAALSSYNRVQVVGMGKAAMAMAGVLEDRHPGLVDDGIVVVPSGYPETLPSRLPSPSVIRVEEGGHPLPTQASERAGRRLLDQARSVEDGDLLLVLVSGGGTALTTLSADGLDLGDLKTVYQLLMKAGVPIHPANVVRKH
ncbi:MAG TPA: DUF4147 domain-containing protein, partial [Salinibacter sp.]|nr:DUF4147 domain-containing protein [Salinibacter sp.]